MVVIIEIAAQTLKVSSWVLVGHYTARAALCCLSDITSDAATTAISRSPAFPTANDEDELSHCSLDGRLKWLKDLDQEVATIHIVA